MAWSKVTDMNKMGYIWRIGNCWDLQNLVSDFKESKAPLSGGTVVDLSHLRGRGWQGWMTILEVIYRFLMSNTLFRFSSKPSHVNICSVFLLSPGRWYVLNTLELCHQSDLHVPFVPTEEKMASMAASEGRDWATPGADRPKDRRQAGPDGYLDKPAHPGLSHAQYTRFIKSYIKAIVVRF